MIGTLQKRFVKTAMTAITVLLLVIVLATGGLYTFRVYSDVHWMAQMLADNGGLPQPGEDGAMRPKDGGYRGKTDGRERSDEGASLGNTGREERQPPDGGETRDGGFTRRGFFPGEKYISADNALSYRFFLVKLSEDGTPEETDVTRIYSVTEEEAGEYAAAALGTGRSSGFTEKFYYYIKKSDGVSTVVFIDASSQLSSVLSVFVISLVIAVICWILMFLLVTVLSRRAIAPIAENMIRQKQFVTNAGHELKTPLAIILANTEALELYNGESKWTGNIKSQVKRLSGLMQNLLTLSKMDEADVNLPMEEIDLRELISKAAADFEEPARCKKIELRYDIPPLKARGNRDSLAQLFGILFDNAVKYTPAGGSISVTARREGKYAVVEQKNSIDPADAVEDPNRLFDRFYRSDEARTQKSGGYGIGLSAAKAIAAANKADITSGYADKESIVFTVKLML